MTINEMKQKRGQLVNEALGLTKAEMNAETRSKIDAIYADADALKGDIERAEKAEQMAAELRGSVSIPSAIGPVEISGDQLAEKRARQDKVFNKFLRQGEQRMSTEDLITLAELRDLSGASNSAGGYTIAPEFSNQLETALKFYGGMRKVATIRKTSTGATLPWPTMNDTSNKGGLLGAQTTPGTVDALDLAFGVVNFGHYTFTTGYINVQNELLQDSAFDLQAEITKAFIERVGRSQNQYFTTGTGSSQPKGIVPAATVGVTAATGGSVSISYADLVNLEHSIDPEYRVDAKFMFNDATLAILRKMVDSQGRPLFGAGINGGDPDKILGYNYVINNDVAVMAANAKSILFGKLDKFMIRDVAGLTILRLDQVRALQNQTTFVGFARADSNLLDAGTNPVKVYVNSAT